VILTPTTGSPAWNAASYAAISTVPPFRDQADPAAVTGLQTAGGTTNTINVHWNQTRDNVYLPSYEIYGSTNPHFTAGPSTLVGETARTSYTQTGLGLKQTWYYRVRAVVGAGTRGPLSPIASATTGLTQRVEAESLLPPVDADAPVSSQGDCCNVSWSGGAQLWFQPTAAGKHVTVAFTVGTAGTYDITAVQTKARDYGINTIAIDGAVTGPTIDAYNNPDVIITAPIDYGTHQLGAGRHTLTLTVTGKNADAIGFLAGLDYFDLTLTG
jgi:predicted phage tail protein